MLAVVAGCGGKSGNGATSGATTKAVAPSTPVAVTRCPTTYGLEGEHLGATPATMPSTLSPNFAKQLRFYAGGLTVLGPAGWKCTSGVGADGGSGITVYPPGDSQQNPSEGIEVNSVPACQGCMADLACPFFANAEAQLGYGTPCPGGIRAGEIITRPSRNVVMFIDPPHVKGNGLGSGGAYEAHGTVVFLPPSKRRSDSATIVECTLPTAESADCAPIINQYVAVLERESGAQFTATWPKITTPTTTSAPPPSPAESQPGYLAYASNGVLFIQWTRTGDNVTGTLSESYTDPSDAAHVSHESGSFTGVISGSSVTLTLDNGDNWNRTLTSSGVTLSYTGSDGTLHTFAFSSGTVAEYNAAVEGITAKGNAAQSEQAQRQATTQAEQQLGSDASTLSTDVSNLQADVTQLDSDLAKVPADLDQMRTDLATQKRDLAVGPEDVVPVERV